MSNARYRTLETPRAPQAPATPSTAELLETAKRFLHQVVQRAQQSLDSGDGRVSIKDGMDAAKQLITIARLEQRQAETAQRQAARAQREAGQAQRQATPEQAIVAAAPIESGRAEAEPALVAAAPPLRAAG